MNEEQSRTAHESSFCLIVLQHKEPKVVCNSRVPQREPQRRNKSSSHDDISSPISLRRRTHRNRVSRHQKPHPAALAPAASLRLGLPVFMKVSPVKHLKIPLGCRNRPVKYRSQRWGGSGWAAWKEQKVLSMLS